MASSKKNLWQKIWMNCEEVTLLSTKMVSGENVTFLHRFRLWVHNKTCPPCGHFHSDNQKIQKLLNQNSKDVKHSLSQEKKAIIQSEIRELN